ncbi:MAG: S8 family serine peptidase [Anaerolineales bacterium]
MKAFSRVGLAIVFVVTSVLSASAPVSPLRAQDVLLQLAQHQPEALVDVIVQKSAQTTVAETLVAQLGGTVTRSLTLINAFAARLPAAAVLELAKNNAVNWVSLDALVRDTDDHPGTWQEDFSFGAVSMEAPNAWPSGWDWSQQPWAELGESDGPVAGDIAITSFLAGEYQGLRLQSAGKGLQGGADLSYASTATLTMAYRRKTLAAGSDFVSVQVSADGGATWAELDRWAGPATDDDLQTATFDISPFISPSFAIRFLTSETFQPEARIYVDYVRLDYSSTFGPGDNTYEGALTNVVYLPLAMSGTADATGAEAPASTDAGTTDYAGNWFRASDYFGAASYSNNNGSTAWETNWVESDSAGSGALIGNITIYAGELWLDDNPDTGTQPSLRREANLTGATQAFLTFDFRTTSGVDTTDRVVVEASSNGGATYTLLETFQNISGTRYDWREYNLTPYISADTVIRFRVLENYGSSNESFVIDNVELRYTKVCASCVDTSRLVGAPVRAVRADQLWNESPYRQGQNVTVAVVDSGIAMHDDLRGDIWCCRVIGGVNFADDWYVDDLNGHGTHVAGIIAGDGYMSEGAYMGVAPKVDLVDVKVLDDFGRGYLSDVVAGLQWINDNKSAYNIRVVNLSLNSTVYESYHQSPLNAALEILWFNGLVVVVSSGNNGLVNQGTVYPPANDPFVITVGAADDRGTVALSDDIMTTFSAYGTPEGIAKPDLVAPGRNIVSLLASDDSNLALTHPLNKVLGWGGYWYFRMSGTSMAAPMVSGAAALLVQDEPNLSPDQVKYRLMATANKSWAGYSAASAGAGYVDVYAAVKGASTQNANTGRQASQLLWGGSQPITWGSVNWNSVNWNSVNWNSVNWNSVNWNSVNWNSEYWEP